MQILAIIVSLAIALVGVALFGKTIGHMVSVIKLGQPAPGRTDQPGQRSVTLAKETLGHTRMLQWSHIGILHWFVAFGFLGLVLSLVTAFGQLFDAHFALPILGHWVVFEWVTELLTWTGLLSILGLIAIRLRHLPSGSEGRYSRFFGSRSWQAYYVEYTILGVLVCILALRALEWGLAVHLGEANKWHFPLTWFLGEAVTGWPESRLENAVYLVAMVKILISFAWMITISLNATMGVAWHRFTAWPNIWFKRKADGGTALGALQPIMVKGEPIDFENIEELDEDAPLGVGKVEDFTWKGLLDFTTCTECGRCQSQCPAWNTDKPLSPKLVMMNLREHAYAKAPYLLASEDDRKSLSQLVLDEQEKPLVGPADVAVIDEEALWACTSCGACVQQCPVDIEHVDAIMDMRRYQVLIESSFPSELNGLFKGLENKGNPWNMSPSGRMDWAKDLPFEVKQVGTDVETLAEVEYLFWVGCAGAYEDRAKKTTQAVAELLNIAGVSFAVLGDGETCTGDPARRAGNEFVFQQLAMQNAEVFKETGAKKVVSTCAHCFNTLKNEYSQLGVELDVIHHTQLLNRLVREGKLTPVAPADSSLNGQKITYHDPCYLGRHNQVYDAPRELLDIIPGAEYAEMPRNKTKSFCCGAGGARMWMEEKIGTRINVNRTTEAVETGADKIATGCPFCRVMLSDGLTAKQADGSAREEVEVQDVAQLLLASVKRG
ncbi:(Fe-S)-binding protein [Kribbella sp. NPDC005582]|uniref:(Fe-S)-binding protein n=1 Tax=Kribbella sp. NPDC005582 TaxID=3156893 RepID=UPI0033AF0EBB